MDYIASDLRDRSSTPTLSNDFFITYKVKVITFYVRSALTFQALPRTIYNTISISISISYGQNILYLWTGREGKTAC